MHTSVSEMACGADYPLLEKQKILINLDLHTHRDIVCFLSRNNIDETMLFWPKPLIEAILTLFWDTR